MWEKYKHIVSHIAVGAGVIDTVADWVCENGYRKVLVVCDPNTRRVAGERVASLLVGAGLDVAEFCFADDEPKPDEHSIGCLLVAYTTDIDIIIGVGSGTINDLCTYVGAKVGCPSAIVGTAPSMDGYASLGSAMLLCGIKITPPTQCPVAIFCDIDILAAAPMHMIAAGVGDMLGKITSLADWRLSHIITGEPIPGDIFDLMQGALEKVLTAAPGIAGQNASQASRACSDEQWSEAIEAITEGLILSGIAMTLYGDSRPASGTEHHLAHYWEMRMLAEGREPALHGTKVGLATVMALVMWKKFGEGIAEGLPEPERVIDILSQVGMQVSPKSIGISSDIIRDSVLYAKDRKPTYTLMQHLSRLGLLEEYGEHIINFFAARALDGIKCFVLDMDGTIYLGNRLFPYTLDFLKYLEKQGKDYVFFTNNSSQNAAHYINKLHNMGIDISPDRLLMSTHVLLDYLDVIAGNGDTPAADASGMSPLTGRKVFVAGTKALMDDFVAAGYDVINKSPRALTGVNALTARTLFAKEGTIDDKPDFCVLGFDTDMDYDRLTKLCDFVRSGIPIYGVNMDYNCPVERVGLQLGDRNDGSGFIPDCGSLAAAVHASTGVKPEFFGKPSHRALDYIIAQTGYREDELCFVGDRLYTDIAIADGTLARSVLVLSGETKIEDTRTSPYVPDLIVDDLRGLM